LFSNLDLKDEAEKILNILDTKSSTGSLINSSGIYWTSKWNSLDTCQSQSADLKPSLIPTAFALSAYVKVKKEGSAEIARWLFPKYSEEEYEPYSDMYVAKALDDFADYSATLNGQRPLLLTNTSE